MPQTIEQWIFHALNTDATLAALWGDPTLNPFNITAQQGAKYPYCVYSLLQQKFSPIYGNPAGPGNDWVFTFQVFAVGAASLDGGKQARLIANRITAMFLAQTDPIGVQLCMPVLRVEHWFELERVYRCTIDFEIRETLACLP